MLLNWNETKGLLIGLLIVVIALCFVVKGAQQMVEKTVGATINQGISQADKSVDEGTKAINDANRELDKISRETDKVFGN